MKGDFLTARWNNIWSVILGLIAVLFFILVLTGVIGTCGSADITSFIALIVIGGMT